MTDKTVVQWLEANKCYDVRAVTVKIGAETFSGASYRQDCTPPQGARNVAVYTQEAIYLVGKLPKVYVRNRHKVAFTIAGGNREWYVASYMPEDKGGKQADLIPSEFAEFHPFGASFQLMPWSVDGKVDDGEPRLYTRVAITVTPAT